MTPQDRDHLRFQLREVLGDDAAETLMEHLPPHRWDELATKDDIARLEDRFDGLEQRFDGLEQRFDGLEQRFDGLGDQFATKDDLERFATKDDLDMMARTLTGELTAAFRGELNAAVLTQGRQGMIMTLGSIAGVGGLALALQALAG